MISTVRTTRKGSRRRWHPRGPLSLPDRREHAPSPRPSTCQVIDIVVLRARWLLNTRERARVIERIDRLARHTARSHAENRGPWLLVLTSSRREAEVGRLLGCALATYCQGTLLVAEGSQEETAQAALVLHALHFPHVPARERTSCILVLGCARERELLGGRPPA